MIRFSGHDIYVVFGGAEVLVTRAELDRLSALWISSYASGGWEGPAVPPPVAATHEEIEHYAEQDGDNE